MVATEEKQKMCRGAVRHVLPIGLLVALLVFAVIACGGDEQQESKARPLPEVRQALRPGTYSSEEFEPSLTFRVGVGWSTSPPEASDTLSITRGDTAGLGFGNIQEVYKPSSATGTIEVVKAPRDMVGWFQKHPYLQTDEPEPVTVGGVKGQQLDVVVAENPPENQLCISRFSDGSIWCIAKADKVRIIVFDDVKGETVTMGFGSPATEFDEFAPEAQKVIDSVEWGGA